MSACPAAPALLSALPKLLIWATCTTRSIVISALSAVLVLLSALPTLSFRSNFLHLIIKGTILSSLLLFSLSKKQASLTKGVALRSVPRLFASGEQFDTRSVRRVFSDVHAAGENDQIYFLPAGKKLCEAFLTVSNKRDDFIVPFIIRFEVLR